LILHTKTEGQTVQTPRVAVRGSIEKDGFDGPGGWNQKRDPQDYASVVSQWRKQTANYEHMSSSAEENDVEETDNGMD